MASHQPLDKSQAVPASALFPASLALRAGHPTPGADPSRPTGVAFLLDVSGSMFGCLRHIKEDLRRALSALATASVPVSVNVIAFNDDIHVLGSHAELCTPEVAEKARVFLSSLRAGGTTNTLGALEAVLADPAVDAIFLVSDGLPNQRPDDILRCLETAAEAGRQPAVHAIAMNCASNAGAHELLKRVAQQTCGTQRACTTAELEALLAENERVARSSFVPRPAYLHGGHHGPPVHGYPHPHFHGTGTSLHSDHELQAVAAQCARARQRLNTADSLASDDSDAEDAEPRLPPGTSVLAFQKKLGGYLPGCIESAVLGRSYLIRVTGSLAAALSLVDCGLDDVVPTMAAPPEVGDYVLGCHQPARGLFLPAILLRYSGADSQAVWEGKLANGETVPLSASNVFKVPFDAYADAVERITGEGVEAALEHLGGGGDGSGNDDWASSAAGTSSHAGPGSRRGTLDDDDDVSSVATAPSRSVRSRGERPKWRTGTGSARTASSAVPRQLRGTKHKTRRQIDEDKARRAEELAQLNKEMLALEETERRRKLDDARRRKRMQRDSLARERTRDRQRQRELARERRSQALDAAEARAQKKSADATTRFRETANVYRRQQLARRAVEEDRELAYAEQGEAGIEYKRAETLRRRQGNLERRGAIDREERAKTERRARVRQGRAATMAEAERAAYDGQEESVKAKRDRATARELLTATARLALHEKFVQRRGAKAHQNTQQRKQARAQRDAGDESAPQFAVTARAVELAREQRAPGRPFRGAGALPSRANEPTAEDRKMEYKRQKALEREQARREQRQAQEDRQDAKVAFRQRQTGTSRHAAMTARGAEGRQSTQRRTQPRTQPRTQRLTEDEKAEARLDTKKNASLRRRQEHLRKARAHDRRQDAVRHVARQQDARARANFLTSGNNHLDSFSPGLIS